jgi:hypothetical protein
LLGWQAHDSGYELVVEALKGFAEAHGEEGIRRFAAAEECVGVDAGGHEVELIQPNWIGDGQVVADAAKMTETEKGAIPALAVLFSNPPPKVIGMSEPE